MTTAIEADVSSSDLPPRIWCAVPVYNNGSTLRAVVEACLAVIPNIVVVDDGSTDADVPALLSDLPIERIRHPRNLGKGEAILTASRFIEDRGGTYMITVDADGQHDPSDIRTFFPLLEKEDHLLVVGARDFNTENVPGSSRFGRSFANFWLRVESGVSCSDCQSGFRAYPVRLLNRLKLRGRRYDFEAEVLAKAAWAGLEIRDVPIGVTYPPADKRVSHFKPFLDNFRLTHRHVLLVLRRLLPLPHARLVPKKDDQDLKVLLHPGRAMKALLNEHASPAALAAAAALGVFLGAVPLLFSHTLVILYVASRLNMNKLVAVNTQHLCMPPLVPALCIEVGYYLRNGRWLTNLSFQTVFEQFKDRVIEWFIGSLIVGPVFAALVGAIVYFSATSLYRRKAAAA